MNGLFVFAITIITAFIVGIYYLHKKQNNEIEYNLKQHYNYKNNKDYVKDFKNKG